MTDMSTRRIVITGAASGLGKAIAEDLAKQGAKLFLIDLPETNLNSVAKSCETVGGKAFSKEADIVTEDLTQVAAQAAEMLGGIDGIINCAGIYRQSLMSQDTMEQAKKVIDINLTANMNISNAFTPLLVQNKSSNLIFLSSLAAKSRVVGLGAYTASKAGVTALAKTTFDELRSAGVKVTSIMPGFIKTPMTESDNLDEAKVMETSVITDTVNYILNFHASGCPTEIVIENQRNPMKKPSF